MQKLVRHEARQALDRLRVLPVPGRPDQVDDQMGPADGKRRQDRRARPVQHETNRQKYDQNDARVDQAPRGFFALPLCHPVGLNIEVRQQMRGEQTGWDHVLSLLSCSSPRAAMIRFRSS